MNDLLLDVPEQTPRWKELAKRHGVEISYDCASSDVPFYEALYKEPNFVAGTTAETEKEAVITLIHRLQLDGWKEVSL